MNSPMPPPSHGHPELVTKAAFRRGCVIGLVCGLLAGMSLAAWIQASLAGKEWYRQKKKLLPDSGYEAEGRKQSEGQ
jgi:hypothetical protein